MGSREILTLQFGHYANFVGTHWWNLQEFNFDYTSKSDIDHDVLFREGLTTRKEVTFTPRLLSVDLKGSLKSIPEQGDLYQPIPDPKDIDVAWNENVEVRTDPKTTDISVWSDYLYTKFHPRSINVIKQYEHNKSDFDIFPLGQTLWASEQFQEEFCDKIRNYIEECDNFQGFHVILDSTDGFSGLASSCMEHICDEYERRPILAIPVVPSYHSDYNHKNAEEQNKSIIQDCLRSLNISLCFNALSEHSSLFVPLSTNTLGWRRLGPKREFNRISYDNQQFYQSSALLAAGLDTFTLGYRLKSKNFSLIDVCKDFAMHGRKAASASLCIPFPFNEGADFIDCLNCWDGPLTRSITPNCELSTDKMMQLFVLRGISEDRLKKSLKFAGKQTEMAAYECKSVQEMLKLYLSCNYFCCNSNIVTFEKRLALNKPFPEIFDQSVGVNGDVAIELRPKNLAVKNIPLLSGLHSGAAIGDMLESLHTAVSKLKLKRFHQFVNAGLESDDFVECFDRLFDLRECYEEKYQI